MGADPNGSVEPFVQITGVPGVHGRMRSDRPMRFSEASRRTDTSRQSEVSRHDAAMPDRVAPLQPGQMLHHQPRHILLPSHSHQRSSSGGQHVSHAQYPSVGAHSVRGRFHHQTGQPLMQSAQYTYPMHQQQPVPQPQSQQTKGEYQPQQQDHQPQRQDHQPQQQEYRRQPQEPQSPQEHQPQLPSQYQSPTQQPQYQSETQQPQYQSQTQRPPLIVLPRDIQVQVSIRRTYLVQVYPRRRVRFRLPRSTSAGAGPVAAATLGVGRRAGMSSSSYSPGRGAGRISWRVGGSRRRLPGLMTPRSSMDYGMEACLEGKALS
jgi:hypothetical protein